MKRDWSVFRITVLLYAIVVLLPLNYYFANHSFESMQSDSVTMNRLVYINGTIQRVIGLEDIAERERLINEVELSLNVIDQDFLKSSYNAEFVALFRANEGFDTMLEAWTNLKAALGEKDLANVLGNKCWREVNNFSKTAEEMLTYKSEAMLDKLYLSLLFTMLTVIALISMVRLYISIQIQKHAIHDHVTGLYNKKYFNEALQKAKLLSTRHESSLSLLALSFDNYADMKSTFKKKSFEVFLHDFSKQLDDFFRHSDTICRIEENCFVIIAPDANLQNARLIADRLQKKLKEHRFGLSKTVTMRIGVADYQRDSGISLLQDANEVMVKNSSFALGE